MANLSPTGASHFIDSQGHTTPESTNLSMTPDPFSPFQRFQSQLSTPESPYAAGLGFHSRVVRTPAISDSSSSNGPSTAKLSNDVSSPVIVTILA